MFIWVSALIIILPSLAGAQSLKKDPRIGSALHLLELWLDAQSAYEKIPGISMAVVHDQELLWAKGFGYADRENKSPATPDEPKIAPLGTWTRIPGLRGQRGRPGRRALGRVPG
jgi:CubicO group peptidase (beta-lactamase class C family)